MFTTPLFLVFLAAAQDYRGEATTVVLRSDPVEFSRLRFLTFVLGHEGPMDAPLATSPVRGRRYFVEADIFGIESAANIRFELIDTANRRLQTASMWKASDAGDDGEFYGFITVPDQPFRAVASGTDRAGQPFRAVLNTLFRPAADGPPEQFTLPPGVSANERASVDRMIAGYRQEMERRATQAEADHPGGLILLLRPTASRIRYEPFNAASGATLGIRLSYSIRFPSQQTVAAVPLVFPAYTQTAWRGIVEMKPLQGTITPAPQMVGVQSLQDVIGYRAAATYQAGVTYNFTIDFVPDYVFQGSLSKRFCIHEEKFTSKPIWGAIRASGSAVAYSVSIGDTETYATIPAFYPQRTFYESFKNSGALDCGPVPNIRF